MSLMRLTFSGLLIWCVLQVRATHAQDPSPPAPSRSLQPLHGAPSNRVNSGLVYLDVTVLDKHGNPVVSGLTQKDFSITQDEISQRIFSFEAPEAHASDSAGDTPSGDAPVTIFVLDQLNATFEQMAYMRYCVHQYLASQPDLLTAPAEVILLDNWRLEVVQAYTRDKSELLEVVDDLPTALSFSLDHPSYAQDRLVQSIEALQKIALQSSAMSGRKNIVWIEYGDPPLYTSALANRTVDYIKHFVQQTTNMLVDARVSLFVIYPEVEGTGDAMPLKAESAPKTVGDEDPFAGEVNFNVFVNATGGKLFTRHDIDEEIRSALELGSRYYTLTYQPPSGKFDGHFTRIRVTLNNPSLAALTKAGYFALEKTSAISPHTRANMELSEALRATVPLLGMTVTVRPLVRHSDTQTEDFVLEVVMNHLKWRAGADGKRSTEVELLAASLDANRDLLASKNEALTILAPTRDRARLTEVRSGLKITLRIPRRTTTVRFVLRDERTRQLGAVEISRQLLDAAPESPSSAPNPVLQRRTTPSTAPMQP